MNIGKVLSSLEITIRKLNDVLSESDGQKLIDELYNELEAIDWVINYIKSNLVEVLAVTGHKNFIDDFILEISDSSAGKVSDLEDRSDYMDVVRNGNQVSVVIMGASDVAFDIADDYFNSERDEGSLLSEGDTLDYLICNRYYLIEEDGDKAIYFNLSIRKEYMSSIGDIINWIRDIFKSLK